MANFIFGQAEELRSAIPRTNDPGILLLGLLARGLVNTEAGLRTALQDSFAYNHYFSQDEDRDQFLSAFMESGDDLLTADLIKHEGVGVQVTDLGAIASASGMSMESFFVLLESLDPTDDPNSILSALAPVLCGMREFRSLPPYDVEARQQVLTAWVDGTPIPHIIEKHSSDQYEVGLGHIRAIGETAAWMLNTASQVSAVSEGPIGTNQYVTALDELAKRCRFGVPSKIVPIAHLRVLRRSELIQLVNNAAGKSITSLHETLDTPLRDFAGILAPQRAELLHAAILDHIEGSLVRRRSRHRLRADRIAGLRPLIESCYDSQGEDFEGALAELLTSKFLQLQVTRFTRQRTGQPDLEIAGTNGTIVLQVTSSEDDRKPVSWAKAREVTSSVGYSGQASNFVTIARPGFHDVAVGNATEIAARGDQRLLLISLPEVMEVCLLEVEGTYPRGTLLTVLENKQGHYLAGEESH